MCVILCVCVCIIHESSVFKMKQPRIAKVRVLDEARYFVNFMKVQMDGQENEDNLFFFILASFCKFDQHF